MSQIHGIYSAEPNKVHQRHLGRQCRSLDYLQNAKIETYLEEPHLAVASCANMDDGKPRQNLKRVGKYLILSDARIDNRLELIATHQLNPEIDNNDLIGYLYNKYKSAIVDHLLGAFVIFIYNRENQEIFCARDKMGVRPLHYYFKGGLFIFSSSKRSFKHIVDGLIDLNVNENYLKRVVGALSQVPEETCYLNVSRLMPAEILTVKKNRISKRRYWKLQTGRKIHYQKPNDYIEHFNEIFSEAVKCRVGSIESVGCELSGGLDSSGVTAMANQLLNADERELFTYSYVNPNVSTDRVNVRELVQSVVSHLKLSQHRNISQAKDVSYVQGIKEAVFRSGGLDTHEAMDRVGIWEKCQKDGVKVLLSGFPGDELVTSFCRSYYLEYLERNQLLKFFKHSKRHVGLLRTIAPLMYKYSPIKYLTKNLIEFIFSLRKSSNEKSFLKSAYLDSSSLEMDFSIFSSLSEQHASYISRYHTSKRMETENSESEEYGLEVRYPLADVRLLEYVISVPLEQRSTDYKKRLLFRNSISHLLPKEIVWFESKNHSTMPFSLVSSDYQKEFDDWLKTLGNKKHRYIDFDKLLRKNQQNDDSKERRFIRQQKLVYKTLVFLDEN